MPRFKLTIEYAGTRYSGWQIQKNAKTVQGQIDAAVRTVTGRKDFELYGAGRTDAGVHAAGQVAHLDVSTSLPAETLRRRLNDELPADIHILQVAVVPHRFHARHDAVARRYLYQIATRRTAFAKPYVWWVKEPLDIDRMRQAARAFVGMHDFASFAASDRQTRSTEEPEAKPDDDRASVVLIDRVDVAQDGALVLVAVEGSHFLWRMVRRLVGVLVAVGHGGLDVSATSRLLKERSDLPARVTAPASGLFLECAFYEGDPRARLLRAITPVA